MILLIPVHTYASIDESLSGSGTENDPYQIRTLDDFNEINEEKINVTFSLLGDEIHDAEEEGDAHTLSMGTLQTWIPASSYSVSANATVKDLLELALAENNMSCRNPGGNYVQSITKDDITLGEFDNGSMSGWMYTLNGTHPLLAVSEQYLEEGDVVVFHYTDQYYYEEGSSGYEEAQAALQALQKIQSIGTVSYNTSSKSKIDAARKAYDALSDDLKSIITKAGYKVLTDAESRYAQLKKADDAQKAKAAYIKQNTPSATALKSVKKKGKNAAVLKWKKIAKASGYLVYMSTKKSTGYKKIASIKKNTTLTYTKKKLTRKRTYYFKVRSYRKVGGVTYYGAYSNIKLIKIK